MAKRFTDNEIWNDPWYREMKPEGKIFWSFLKDRCDAAGFWKKDYKLAAFQCGVEMGDNLLALINEGKERVKDHGEHLEIVGFIEFQYGVLKDEVKPHRPILRLLENYKLKGYRKGINTPKEKDKEKDKETEKETENDFEKFWSSYPRKVAKKKAELAWKKVPASQYDNLFKALDSHKRSPQWQKDGGQFIPHPTTWLNQNRWEDEINLTTDPPPPQKKKCQDCGQPTFNFLCENCVRPRRNPRLDEIKKGFTEKSILKP